MRDAWSRKQGGGKYEEKKAKKKLGGRLEKEANAAATAPCDCYHEFGTATVTLSGAAAVALGSFRSLQPTLFFCLFSPHIFLPPYSLLHASVNQWQ